MANLRNEFEFRSALLTALGQEHTEAEAKNEEMWRRKMLDGLGVEYDQNDVNQFGLFREKLIEGVTSKSEGGGESDFTKVNVTLEVSVDGNYGNYNIYLIDSDRNATALSIGAVQTPFGELRIFNTQSLEEQVEYGSSITKEIYLYQNNYFVVTETNADAPSDFALTGNAEAVMGEISGDSACLVKVYGDCTISVAGGR